MSGSFVPKFGGSSLAGPREVENVIEIIKSDPRRRFVVVSAAGKRHKDDTKVTDLLLRWYETGDSHIGSVIHDRHAEIVQHLGLGESFDFPTVWSEIRRTVEEIHAARLFSPQSEAYVASRGEILMAQIVAAALNYPFVDATQLIHIPDILAGEYGPHTKTGRYMFEKLGPLERAVIPGFCGENEHGGVDVFSRGGSDITGSVVAHYMRAAVSENWTDVSGVCVADPKTVGKVHPIEVVTYEELRELAYSGANVMHDFAIYPVMIRNIPIHILNTQKPDDAGTRIVPDAASLPKSPYTITGIASRDGFVVFNVYKHMLNQEMGVASRLLQELEHAHISVEHVPTGLDSISLVVHGKQLNDGLIHRIYEQLENELRSFERNTPSRISVERDLSLIVVVGRDMRHNLGVLGKIGTALGNAGVNIRLLSQGGSGISIIIGVDTSKCKEAVRAIYNAFVPSS